MTRGRKNILLVHSGRRDEYEVAMALSTFYNVTLLTDFYYDPKRIFSRILKRFLGSKVYLRNKEGLNCKVVTSIPLLILDFLGKYFPRNSFLFKLKNKFFEIKSKSILRLNEYDFVLFYSNHGASGVFRSDLAGFKKILFQMHPHPNLVLANYKEYILLRQDLRDQIHKEEEELAEDANYTKDLIEEAHLSDLVICTTTFTQESLIYAGIDPKRIIVIPYGIKSKIINTYKRDFILDNESHMINLAFVGQFIVRKGIYELLDAVKSNPSINLSIYTRDANELKRVIPEYMGSSIDRVTFKNILDNNQLWEDARKHDFLILPSLVEGFGLVILEALSYGLPVIASRNTAAPDIVSDGIDGFILNEINSQAINQLIDTMILQKKSWGVMRKAAIKKAKQHHSIRFRKKIIGAVSAI
jgi:glycosyltransferase involved in cell wall biosynthesis